MVLEVFQHTRKSGALEVGTFFVRDKGCNELAAFQDEFFHAQQLRDPTKPDGPKQFFGGIRQGPKPILQAVPEPLHVLCVMQVVQLAVEGDPFGNVTDVMVRNQKRQVSFQHGLFDKTSRFDLVGFHQVLELFLLQFFDGFCQNPLVHVKPEVVDEPALLGTEKVSGAPNVQIPHGNLHARTQV